MSSTDDIRPFTIHIPDSKLDSLRAKLEITRLPEELDIPLEQQWDWGIPLSILKPIVEYWKTQYDWRAVEHKINETLPQFVTHVDSLGHGAQEVHFVHKRSKNPDATPLIFVHGWPGNFLEVSHMIDDLVDPKDPNAPAFHVVAPSLPGYVFSQRASSPGMNAKGSAALFNNLMIKLGYTKYIAQGGDWGALVSRSLALYHSDNCIGIHLNMTFMGAPSFRRDPWSTIRTILGFSGLPGGITAEEVKALKDGQEVLKHGMGYMKLQGTRPQTLAFALTDSPAGLLAWIGEKLYAWTDNYPWTPEEIITWTMLYWVNGPAGGLRYYKENQAATNPSDKEGIEVRTKWTHTPVGFSKFAREIFRPPIEWVASTNNLVYSNTHDRGGHFAAWEVPELLAEDIRTFARIVLAKDFKPQMSPPNPWSPIVAIVCVVACASWAIPRVAPHLKAGRS